jgi:hypothetical protein
MTDNERIQLGQLDGAILTYEKADGTRKTVDFDEHEPNLGPDEDEEEENRITANLDDYDSFA